jgi:hypothetical protein
MPRRFGLLVDNFRAECFADKPPDTDHVMVFLALMDCTTSSTFPRRYIATAQTHRQR